MELKPGYLCPPGYKQTEVGVIPKGWNIASLGDLVDQSRSIRYGIVQPGKYDSQGRFMIRGQDYSKGWVDPSDLFKVGPVVEERYRNARVKAKDLIITIVGAGTGYVESVPEWLDGANLTQTTARIAVDPAKADSGFCKFILQSSFGKNQVSAYIKGAAQPGLNCGDVEKFLLPLPPSLSEQRAIAGALSDVDALIGALGQLIAKKRDFNQATMQQLLTGQTRLPGFTGQWKVKSMGECLRSRPDYGINAAAVPYSARLPVYIRITDISDDGRFRPEKLVSVGLANADQYYLSEGDLVFARTGASVGKSYLYKQQDGPLVFAGFLIRVRPDPDLLKASYLSAYVTTNAYWDWVRLMSMRSGQPGINGNEYAQLSLTLPPVPEQTAIAQVLSDMGAELEALELRRDKTRDLKQGMMQELLTGRTRLV